jgi:hypothetical protein
MKLRGPAVVGSALMLGALGCTLTKSDLRKQADTWMPTLGRGELGATGRLIVPKQCALRMALVARPPEDEAFQEALWKVADTQAIGDEARLALEANGLRVGVVTGDLPPEVRTVLTAPPPNKVDLSTVILPDGESTLIDPGAAADELNLLLNRGASVAGKRYQDAHGHLRLIVAREGETGVTVQVLPEIAHGPVRQGWSSASGGAGALAPQQLIMRNGQQEETFRDLAASLALGPNQVLVVAALPEKKGSLGHFLLVRTVPNSDRPLHQVFFLWASRSDESTPEGPPSLLPADDPPTADPPARRASATATATATTASAGQGVN